MKQFILVFIHFIHVCQAQPSLSITTDKTTSLIFPFPVTHVDRGTSNILVQPIKENDNILLVKAAVKDFKETNLSVVTRDGNVYSFTVRYNAAPDGFVYEVPVNHKASVAMYATGILDNKAKKITRVNKFGITASVTGIYIKDEVIYYQLQIVNHSPLDYDIDLMQFFIRDKKKSKRTAIQENQLNPLYVAGNSKKVKGYNFSVVVVALDKFTIPDAKFLGIRILEKNGGRHFKLKLYNKQILKAIVLPDLH